MQLRKTEQDGCYTWLILLVASEIMKSYDKVIFGIPNLNGPHYLAEMAERSYMVP